MINHKHSTEQILVLLQKAADLQQAGKPLDTILHQLEITETTYLQWRAGEEIQNGGLQECIKGLRRENDWLHVVMESMSQSSGATKDLAGGDFQ